MGRILFIRVSAVTYDEKDVLKAWPRVCAMVWPDVWGDVAASAAGESAEGAGVRTLMGPPVRGVLELVDALDEYVRFGDMPDAQKKLIAPSAASLAALRHKLDDALGDRAVELAHSLTNAVEDGLDEVERALR